MNGMSELVKGSTIELDRPRTLRLDLRAARLFKELTKTETRPEGISILRGEVGDALDEESLPALIYACLKHEDPDLTPEFVAEQLDFPTLFQALEAISAQVEDFFPPVKEGEAPGDPTPARIPTT